MVDAAGHQRAHEAFGAVHRSAVGRIGRGGHVCGSSGARGVGADREPVR
jgi:hypothetical protein